MKVNIFDFTEDRRYEKFPVPFFTFIIAFVITKFAKLRGNIYKY
jgi:hypothetical protein